MKNVWVSIGEQWGVQNTKGKDGDARICEGVGPQKDHEGYINYQKQGDIHMGEYPPLPMRTKTCKHQEKDIGGSESWGTQQKKE